jgi:Restriction endonuclease
VSQIVSKTEKDETVIFGYDHALGFFFDKYDTDDYLFPVLELSTIQNDLDQKLLLEQIEKWLTPSEKLRLRNDIEKVIYEGQFIYNFIPKLNIAYNIAELLLPGNKKEIIRLSPSFSVLEKLIDGGIRLDSLHWREFEELIAELLEKDGYSVELGSGRNDGGKDLIATKDLGENGLFRAVWQAKHKKASNKVGIEVIRELADTRSEHKASKGILVTSTYLTQGALERVQRDKYILGKVDKDDLMRWVDRVIRNRSN